MTADGGRKGTPVDDEFLNRMANDVAMEQLIMAARSLGKLTAAYHLTAVANGLPSDVAKVCAVAYVHAIVAAATEARRDRERGIGET